MKKKKNNPEKQYILTSVTFTEIKLVFSCAMGLSATKLESIQWSSAWEHEQLNSHTYPKVTL